MEAVGVIGLVGNLTQFLSFGHEILSLSREAYRSASGATDDIRRITALTESVRSCAKKIADAVPLLSPAVASASDSIQIQSIAEECLGLSADLLRKLEQLQIRRTGWRRRAEAIKLAGRLWWSRPAVDDLLRQLLSTEARLVSWWNDSLQSDRHSCLTDVLQSLNQKADKLVAEHTTLAVNNLANQLNQDFNFLSVQTTSYQNQLDDLAKAVRTQTQTYESQIMNAHKDHFASLRQITLQIASYIDSIRSTERFQRVIESLCFDGINARYNGIDEAHPGTLDWTVLERRTNFKEWLEKGAGVYWVNGLAGSGKSTLMRYMTTSQSTQAALQVWAATGNSQPVIASHFFWNSGSPMQKSLQGLLQTILYWLFRSSPSLIEALCLHRQRAQPWDLDELSRTLEMVAEAPERGVNIQYCLFIDGLDEFDGEVEMLVHTMTKLAASPNVKVCVSSRPWSCFLSAWGRSEFTFKVQDFNRPDIIKYVQDKLVNRDQLPTINATDIERLAAEITENSGGVWLWVRLVVRDLLRDIRDNEPVEQLYKRLRSIPSDLYEYFRKILHRVDPIYRQESARIFLLCLAAVKPPDMLVLSMISLLRGPIDSCGSSSPRLSEDEYQALCHRWVPRLQNRCGDLMKLQRHEWPFEHRGVTVEFLHRTVAEFLANEHWATLQQHAGPNFEVSLYLCSSIIFVMRRSPCRGTEEDRGWLRIFTTYCRLVETYATQKPDVETLARLLKTMLGTNYARPFYTDAFQLVNTQDRFLATIINLRFLRLLALELETNPDSIAESRIPYLLFPLGICVLLLPYCASGQMSGIFRRQSKVDLWLLSALLRRGGDPNQDISPDFGGKASVWVYFLFHCYGIWRSIDDREKQDLISAIKLLVQHGAHLYACVCIADDTLQWLRWYRPGAWQQPTFSVLELLAAFMDPVDIDDMRELTLAGGIQRLVVHHSHHGRRQPSKSRPPYYDQGSSTTVAIDFSFDNSPLCSRLLAVLISYNIDVPVYSRLPSPPSAYSTMMPTPSISCPSWDLHDPRHSKYDDDACRRCELRCLEYKDHEAISYLCNHCRCAFYLWHVPLSMCHRSCLEKDPRRFKGPFQSFRDFVPQDTLDDPRNNCSSTTWKLLLGPSSNSIELSLVTMKTTKNECLDWSLAASSDNRFKDPHTCTELRLDRDRLPAVGELVAWVGSVTAPVALESFESCVAALVCAYIGFDQSAEQSTCPAYLRRIYELRSIYTLWKTRALLYTSPGEPEILPLPQQVDSQFRMYLLEVLTRLEVETQRDLFNKLLLNSSHGDPLPWDLPLWLTVFQSLLLMSELSKSGPRQQRYGCAAGPYMAPQVSYQALRSAAFTRLAQILAVSEMPRQCVVHDRLKGSIMHIVQMAKEREEKYRESLENSDEWTDVVFARFPSLPAFKEPEEKTPQEGSAEGNDRI